jgi:hypothetical protein
VDAFGTVVIVVSVVAAVVAVWLFLRADRLYRQIGRLGLFSLDHDDEPDGVPREAIRAEVERQLEARSRRLMRARARSD